MERKSHSKKNSKSKERVNESQRETNTGDGKERKRVWQASFEPFSRFGSSKFFGYCESKVMSSQGLSSLNLVERQKSLVFGFPCCRFFLPFIAPFVFVRCIDPHAFFAAQSSC